MANTPTIYIVASDQHRNGKTLLSRLLADYLMLDGHDPFLIDTDAPDGPLRNFFPGRTALANLSHITGQMKLFDTILSSPGRDYIIDLPARHLDRFFSAEHDLHFFAEARQAGFRIFLFFVVDNSMMSLRAGREMQEYPGTDLFIPVRNELVGSAWPKHEGALTIPALPAAVALTISDRRFSLRSFIQGDRQGLAESMLEPLQEFLYGIMSNLTDLEPLMSLQGLRR